MSRASHGRSGVSSQPRIAIRRFTINRVGLAGLANRGLFPIVLVPQLEALVQAGMTLTWRFVFEYVDELKSLRRPVD